MKKYFVIYYAPKEMMEHMMNVSPDQAAEGMKTWMEWKERCGDGVVDLGSPLGNGQKMMASGSAPSEKNIVGYSILQADHMDEVKAMLKGHPHLAWSEGCSIEVYETLPLPGM